MSNWRYEVEREFACIGRTFSEYTRMFALDHGTVAGRSILDCGAGPSSFTAIASTWGSATALDPAYGTPISTVERRCENALDRTATQLREHRDRFVWTEYGDVDTRLRYLRAAFRRFLADYAANPGRYVGGRLPDLPFDDGAFDVALSGSLLFLYDDRLDREFHLASLRELARVASDVRVFPLHGLDARRSALVDPVVRTLEAEGYEVRLSSVPYEFQPDATEMLVVSSSRD